MKRSEMDGHVMTRTDQALRLLAMLPTLKTLDAVDDDLMSGRRPCPLNNFTIADVRTLRALLTSGEDESQRAVALDAERWRWYRENPAWESEAWLDGLAPAFIDAEIDRARLAGKEKADG